MEWQTSTTILARLRSGDDESAWDDLVTTFRPPILAFVRRMGVEGEAAEEIAQDALTTFVESFRAERYAPERGRLSSWLFGIVVNHVRRHRCVPSHPSGRDGVQECAAPDGTRAWDDLWERALLDLCLDRARAEFDAVTFRAFELVILGERTAEQVAAMLGVTRKSVYNAKHRVLRRVRSLRDELDAT